jgi:hypothetical protein
VSGSLRGEGPAINTPGKTTFRASIGDAVGAGEATWLPKGTVAGGRGDRGGKTVGGGGAKGEGGGPSRGTTGFWAS